MENRHEKPGLCRAILSLTTLLILALLLLNFNGTAMAREDGAVSDIIGKVTKPLIVYVADFSLDARANKEQSSRGPLQVRKRVRDKVDSIAGDNPEEEARKIVDRLATTIVKELADKKVDAARLSGRHNSGLTRPSWLLEGEFVEYDEGDRLKRAIIGFGSGSATMGVSMRLTEITEGGRKVLFDSSKDSKKNRMPGAVVSKNPYVAGAKFVMTKAAPEREVAKLGKQIAQDLYDFMKKEGFVQP